MIAMIFYGIKVNNILAIASIFLTNIIFSQSYGILLLEIHNEFGAELLIIVIRVAV